MRKTMKTLRQFPLVLMGVLAPPIDTSGNFSSTCLQSHLTKSPPTPQNSYLKFQNFRTTPSGNIPLVHPKLA